MRAESEDSISAAFDGEWSRVRTMKVSDIKAELELRSIDFSGCFERDDLVEGSCSRVSKVRRTRP
jgi:hypothetical protein